MAKYYRAFISYSHADAAFARWLHGWLETYRFPKSIVGTATLHGPLPTRLPPIFRDREELPASASLTTEVQAALDVSAALVVVCSPAAARSQWVNREIEVFRAAHPDRPILLALIAGEPYEAFPPALKAGDISAEPLAADFRKDRDGRKLGLLKLIAGLADMPLADLMQRDAQRKLRRVTAVTLLAGGLLIAMAAMTYIAIQSREEAERRHDEAEGLVEYMLTDLRDELRGVGRLDVMGGVNDRLMSYYDGQGDLDALPGDSLERRARLLRVIGVDQNARGDLDAAERSFRASHRATAALLEDDPDNPERILRHAESQNRIALLLFTRGEFDRAIAEWQPVLAMLDQIESWGSDRNDWRQLAAFAHGNSCAGLVSRDDAPIEDIGHCQAAVRWGQQLAATSNDRETAQYDLAYHYLWLGLASLRAGEPDISAGARRRYLALVDQLVSREPDNMLWRELSMEIHFHHARILRRLGRDREAQTFIASARETSELLTRHDAENGNWRAYRDQMSSREIDDDPDAPGTSAASDDPHLRGDAARQR